MILKALTLENFKGIHEPVRVEFAPLTLLFGPNNAGKSTIVQALMYAREVLERNNCDAGRTQLGGDVVDLGGFENLVYGHDLTRAIRMRFELDLRGVALPLSSDWVRGHEIESQLGWQYKDAPSKLHIDSIECVWSRLLEVWVEIDVAVPPTQGIKGPFRPLVRAYSVGSGADVYAKITLDQDTNQACLSHFNFGVYPFGTRYTKGDATDSEWGLRRVVRESLRNSFRKHDQPARNLRKGARIAMMGEDVRTGDNAMSRRDFDEFVDSIVNGAGRFGDATIENEGGEHNPSYSFRESLLKKAEALTQALTRWGIIDDDEDVDAGRASGAAGEASGHGEAEARSCEVPSASPAKNEDVSNADRPPDVGGEWTWSDWESRHSLSPRRLLDIEEVDSWLLDLFDALLLEEYVPRNAEYAMPLRLRGSALPEWGRLLEPDPKVWIPDNKNEFWEYPIFAQECLKDLLATVIVAPSELLLRALQNSIYLSPFREMPPRYYQPVRSPEPRRWANGLAAWDWLLLEQKSFAAQVNEWLAGRDRFDAGYEIEVRHYRELEVDSELLAVLTSTDPRSSLDLNWVREQLLDLPEGRRLKIRDLRRGISVFPQDLGVGISQIVPVIVAALHNSSGIVAIEEPESNVHPRFQVVLADLFLSRAKVNPDLVFLVETHSEHLMLRCLRRIRETCDEGASAQTPRLRPEDIAVHFVEPDEHGPRIHRIRIDQEGEFLDPWPRGFFPERMKEIYGDDL